MTRDDYREFAAVLTGTAEVYNADLTDTKAELYFQALSDLQIGTFRAACGRAIAELKFFPKPAEIRELAGALQPALQDRALRAWQEAWGAAESVGSYESVAFDDVVTSFVIRQMGGWPKFCRPDQDDQWHRKEFLDLYRAYDRDRETLPAEHLCGLVEADNRDKGLTGWIAGPRRIGSGSVSLPEHPAAVRGLLGPKADA